MESCEWCGSPTPKLDYKVMIVLCAKCHNMRIEKLEKLTGKKWAGLKRNK